VFNGSRQLMLLSCGSEMTILQLKKQICNRMRVQLEALSLRCGAAVLGDERVPYAMDAIRDGSRIHASVMLPGP
jgi:hypothetical protein